MKNWISIKKLKVARWLLRTTLSNQNFRIAYIANIALAIYDNRRKDGRLNIHNCNDVAEIILNTVFGCKLKK